MRHKKVLKENMAMGVKYVRNMGYLFISWYFNCETRVLNKFSAHRLKKFKYLVLLIVMIVAHI